MESGDHWGQTRSGDQEGDSSCGIPGTKTTTTLTTRTNANSCDGGGGDFGTETTIWTETTLSGSVWRRKCDRRIENRENDGFSGVEQIELVNE